MVMANCTARTADKEAEFLEALTTCGNVTRACEIAQVSRRSVYEWRDADESFAGAWIAAQRLGTEALEDEATRRAFEGTLRPVFHQGAECGVVREFSDVLMVFLLKARNPDRFKERSATELTGKDGAAVVPVLNVTINRD